MRLNPATETYYTIQDPPYNTTNVFTDGNFTITNNGSYPELPENSVGGGADSVSAYDCRYCRITITFARPVYALAATFSLSVNTGIMLGGYEMPDPAYWLDAGDPMSTPYFSGFCGYNNDRAYTDAWYGEGDYENLPDPGLYFGQPFEMDNIEFVELAPEPAAWGLALMGLAPLMLRRGKWLPCLLSRMTRPIRPY